ncbi:MAG: hypothetical protein K2Q06_00780, partial [Parvularculaceae bacterium]|nr:hypothetical protein [Parvularculaceae bacterium]
RAEVALLEAEAGDLAVARDQLAAAVAALVARRDAIAQSAMAAPSSGAPHAPSLADIESEFAAALDAVARAREDRP